MQAGKSGKSETRVFPCCSCHLLGNKAGLHFCRLSGISERQLWDTRAHVGAHTRVQNRSSLNTCTHERTCTYHHTIHMCMQPSPSLYILNTFILYTCVHTHTPSCYTRTHIFNTLMLYMCTHTFTYPHYTCVHTSSYTLTLHVCSHPHIASYNAHTHTLIYSHTVHVCTHHHILSGDTCVHTSLHIIILYLCIHPDSPSHYSCVHSDKYASSHRVNAQYTRSIYTWLHVWVSVHARPHRTQPAPWPAQCLRSPLRETIDWVPIRSCWSPRFWQRFRMNL